MKIFVSTIWLMYIMVHIIGAQSAPDSTGMREIFYVEKVFPCVDQPCPDTTSRFAYDTLYFVPQREYYLPLDSFRIEKVEPHTKEYESYPSEQLVLSGCLPIQVELSPEQPMHYDILCVDGYLIPHGELVVGIIYDTVPPLTFYFADRGTFDVKKDGVYIQTADGKKRKIALFLFHKQSGEYLSEQHIQKLIKR